MPSLFPDPVVAPRTTTPSKSGWVSAHCDGGARGNPGPSGYGAVLQDESGHILAELSEFLGNRTNNYAEYSGLLGCLQWTLDNHHSRLRVVSDSELMVKQIQGKYKVNSPDLRPLWEEAKRRIAQLDKFEISHALRHKNKDADRLANQAMDRGTNRNSTPATPRTTPPPATSRNTPGPGSPPSASGTLPEPPQTSPRPTPQMLRGFTRDGVVHILGSTTLPDGLFVKIIPE
jgi:ribonuclease HI